MMRYRVEVLRYDTSEALLRIIVESPVDDEPIEVRGQVHGPHLDGVQTVEIAYPILPVPGMPAGQLWISEPLASPYRYRGTLALYQAGELREEQAWVLELRPRTAQ